MSKKNNVKYKCPFCERRYTKENLVRHIDDNHEDLIPQDFTAFRYVFNYVNKKPIDYHGRCTECKGPTEWDENKGRYNRQCNNPACKESFIKKFEANMIRTRGVTRISSTPEGLEKMLANRKISGKYKFKNGVEKTYTGSYELKALEFMDQVMNISPDDIISPGPVLEYTYKETKHLYITDFYYQPYNLIIEVKDGGNRPNKRDMPDYRAKQIAKEEFIIKNTNYNYLRLTDNDLGQLLAVFADLKLQMVENTGERVIHINENFIQQVLESTIKSNIDKEYKPKGKKSLSEFKQIKGTKNNIDKYKETFKLLKHIDSNDNVYLWIDNDDNLMGVVAVDDKTYPDYDWITAIEVTKNYQGYGLGKQLLDYAVKKMNGTALAVNKNNEVAKQMYEKYGFKASKESIDKVNSGKSVVYFMYYESKNKQISEAMNALLTGYIPGMKDEGSVYIVNYMKNNVFSGEEERGYAISDNCKLTNLICRNKEGILEKAPNNFLENATYDVFLTDKPVNEISKSLEPFMGTFVEEGFLYETLFGKKMYTYDQIMTEKSAFPVIDYYKGMELFKEVVKNYIRGNVSDKSYMIRTENSIMGLEIGSDKDKSCISYMSLKDDKFRLESVEFPDLFIESDHYMDNNSVEKHFLDSLIIGGKING